MLAAAKFGGRPAWKEQETAKAQLMILRRSIIHLLTALWEHRMLLGKRVATMPAASSSVVHIQYLLDAHQRFFRSTSLPPQQKRSRETDNHNGAHHSPFIATSLQKIDPGTWGISSRSQAEFHHRSAKTDAINATRITRSKPLIIFPDEFQPQRHQNAATMIIGIMSRLWICAEFHRLAVDLQYREATVPPPAMQPIEGHARQPRRCR